MVIRCCADYLPNRDTLAGARERLLARTPLVHCLSNHVSANFVANALLAIGASPAMADHPDEAAGVARQAGAVLVNLGAPTDARLAAMRRATAAAHDAECPWVLDPIGVGALPLRHEFAESLLTQHPTVIRGNASEIIGLVEPGSGGRGVDSAHTPHEAQNAARELLTRAGGVAISGAVDRLIGVVDDNGRPRPVMLEVTGGSAWQPRVTGTGCALGAMVAAYAAVCDDVLTAMTAAHAHAAAAAERAQIHAGGPGSFAVAWLDALGEVAIEELLSSGRVTHRWL